MRSSILSLLLMLCVGSVGAQNYLAPNEFIYRLPNNLTVLAVEEPASANTTLTIHFNIGAFAEKGRYDDLNDVLIQIVQQQLSATVNKVPGSTLTYKTAPELVTYTITTNANNTKQLIDTIGQSFLTFTIDTAIFENARSKVYAQWATWFSDADFNKNDTIQHKAWGYYFDRISRAGNYANLDTADVALLSKMYTEFICASNSFIIIQAPLDNRKIREIAMVGFDGWQACRQIRATQNMIPGYQSLIQSNQTVIKGTSESTTLNLAYQGPTLHSKKLNALTAMVFAELLNNSMPGDSDLVPYQVQVNFGLYKHAAPLLIELQLTDENVCNFYLNKDSLLLLRLTQTLADSNKLKQAKQRVIDSIATFSTPQQRMKAYGKFWSYNYFDLMYFIKDSVNRVSAKDVEAFFANYLFNHSYAAVLETSTDSSANGADSCFVSTYNYDEYFSFSFKKNTGIYSDSTNTDKLNSLYQLLRINTTLKVIMIGLAGTDEMAKVDDETLLKAFKNRPGFYIYPDKLVPTNKIKLEVYRTMIITNYLFEKGVPTTQISSTAQKLKSGQLDDKDAARKVTLHFYY